MIEAEKDITLNEMVVQLGSQRGIVIGRSALNNWLRRQGFTYKKDRTCTGARAARRPEEAPGLV